MNRLITITFLILTLSASAIGQNKKNNFKHIFSNSDSVLISSHEDLRTSNSSGKGWFYKPITINGNYNKAIVHEILKLDNISKDSLVNILTTINKDSIIQDIQCFEPHHSILIYRNGKCSYFDICFGCRHFISSKKYKI